MIDNKSMISRTLQLVIVIHLSILFHFDGSSFLDYAFRSCQNDNVIEHCIRFPTSIHNQHNHVKIHNFRVWLVDSFESPYQPSSFQPPKPIPSDLPSFVVTRLVCASVAIAGRRVASTANAGSQSRRQDKHHAGK